MESVTRLQILRGTTSERLSFTPLKGELVFDEDTNFLYIGNAITPGGVLAAPLAASTNKLIMVVRNETGLTIPKGTPVHIASATPGGLPLIAPSRADTIATLPVIGVTEVDILDLTTGVIILVGEVGEIDTSMFAAGDDLYLGPTGGFVNAPPFEPNAVQVVGHVGASDPLIGTVIVSPKPTLRFQNLPGGFTIIGTAGGNTVAFDLTSALAAKYDASNPNGYETPTQLDARDTANRSRANHTGTQLASTISDFAATVRATVLTGLSLASSTIISATDTILVALGSLQAQVTLRALAARQIINGYGITGGGDLTADRTLAVGLTPTVVSSLTNDTTTSTTYVLMNTMTSTPAAGTYLVMFSGTVSNSTKANNQVQISIFSGGAQVTESERFVSAPNADDRMPVTSNAVVTVNGSQAIETRWKVTGNTGTSYVRSMRLLRIS